MNIRNILVPTDFSPSAELGTRRAFDLAQRCGAAVHLLHVAAVSLSEPLHALYRLLLDEGGDADHLERALNERIDETIRTYAAPGVKVHRAEAQGGNVAGEVLGYAEAHDIDLIVMGTHGHRSLLHPALGGLTGEIVRRARCPVYAVRFREEGAAAPADGDVRHLLVPVDFSQHAERIVAEARAFAGCYGASLALLFVAEEHVYPIFSDTGLPTISVLEMDPEVVDRAGEALRQLYAGTTGPDVPVTFLVRKGNPVQEILHGAEEQAADLIVLGTHGLTADTRFTLGRVSEKVVRKAPCDVLVLRVLGRSLLE